MKKQSVCRVMKFTTTDGRERYVDACAKTTAGLPAAVRKYAKRTGDRVKAGSIHVSDQHKHLFGRSGR